MHIYTYTIKLGYGILKPFKMYVLKLTKMEVSSNTCRNSTMVERMPEMRLLHPLILYTYLYIIMLSYGILKPSKMYVLKFTKMEVSSNTCSNSTMVERMPEMRLHIYIYIYIHINTY
jgi:hypothetical protein